MTFETYLINTVLFLALLCAMKIVFDMIFPHQWEYDEEQITRHCKTCGRIEEEVRFYNPTGMGCHIYWQPKDEGDKTKHH